MKFDTWAEFASAGDKIDTCSGAGLRIEVGVACQWGLPIPIEDPGMEEGRGCSTCMPSFRRHLGRMGSHRPNQRGTFVAADIHGVVRRLVAVGLP